MKPYGQIAQDKSPSDVSGPPTRIGESKLHLTRRALLLSSAALLLIPRRARADALTVASEDNYPPFAFNQRGRRRGLDVEKVEKVLGELRHRAVHHPMLRPAMLDALDEGTIDMAFAFVGTPERFKKYHLVGPLHIGRTVFAVRATEPREPSGFQSLSGRRVGVVDGFTYTPEFDAARGFDRVPCTNVTLALRRLVAGRVDVVLGDRSSLAYIAKAEGIALKVRVGQQPLAEGPRYCAFPKSHGALAAVFAEALARMEAAGRFAEIHAKFGEGPAAK